MRCLSLWISLVAAILLLPTAFGGFFGGFDISAIFESMWDNPTCGRPNMTPDCLQCLPGFRARDDLPPFPPIYEKSKLPRLLELLFKVPPQRINDCLYCKGNRKGSLCDHCESPKQSIISDCTTCINPGFASDCKTCINGWKGSDCNVCDSERWDESQGCAKCLPPWKDFPPVRVQFPGGHFIVVRWGLCWMCPQELVFKGIFGVSGSCTCYPNFQAPARLLGPSDCTDCAPHIQSQPYRLKLPYPTPLCNYCSPGYASGPSGPCTECAVGWAAGFVWRSAARRRVLFFEPENPDLIPACFGGLCIECNRCDEAKGFAPFDPISNPDCRVCRSGFSGSSCNQCTNPRFQWPYCDGRVCIEGFGPAPACDQCVEPNVALPSCRPPSCSARAAGPDCSQCVGGWRHSGTSLCAVCDPLWAGEACDRCASNFAMRCGECREGQCNYPFTGPLCNECLPGWGPPGLCSETRLVPGYVLTVPAQADQQIFYHGTGMFRVEFFSFPPPPDASVECSAPVSVDVSASLLLSSSELGSNGPELPVWVRIPVPTPDMASVQAVVLTGVAGTPWVGVGVGLCFLHYPLPLGLLSGSCIGTLASGASCTFDAVAGFSLFPGSALTRQCLDGAATPMPQLTGCLPPASPSVGLPGDCDQVLADGTSCLFECAAGYEFVGTPFVCRGNRLVGGGSCQPRRCRLGATLAFLNLSYPTASVTPFVRSAVGPSSALPHQSGVLGACGADLKSNSSCSITCAEGCIFIGEPIQCHMGVLSGGSQRCDALPCYNPAAFLRANSRVGSCGNEPLMPNGTTCSITCDEGYRVVGDSYSCYRGVLSGGPQTCQAESGRNLAPNATVRRFPDVVDLSDLATCTDGVIQDQTCDAVPATPSGTDNTTASFMQFTLQSPARVDRLRLYKANCVGDQCRTTMKGFQVFAATQPFPDAAFTAASPPLSGLIYDDEFHGSSTATDPRVVDISVPFARAVAQSFVIRCPNGGLTLREVEIYGSPLANLAINASGVASPSEWAGDGIRHSPAACVDGVVEQPCAALGLIAGPAFNYFNQHTLQPCAQCDRAKHWTVASTTYRPFTLISRTLPQAQAIGYDQPWDGVAGNTFFLSFRNATVQAFSVYCLASAGSMQTVHVGLRDTDNDVDVAHASVTAPCSSPGGWLELPLDLPVALRANTTYQVFQTARLNISAPLFAYGDMIRQQIGLTWLRSFAFRNAAIGSFNATGLLPLVSLVVNVSIDDTCTCEAGYKLVGARCLPDFDCLMPGLTRDSRCQHCSSPGWIAGGSSSRTVSLFDAPQLGGDWSATFPYGVGYRFSTSFEGAYISSLKVFRPLDRRWSLFCSDYALWSLRRVADGSLLDRRTVSTDRWISLSIQLEPNVEYEVTEQSRAFCPLELRLCSSPPPAQMGVGPVTFIDGKGQAIGEVACAQAFELQLSVPTSTCVLSSGAFPLPGFCQTAAADSLSPPTESFMQFTLPDLAKLNLVRIYKHQLPCDADAHRACPSRLEAARIYLSSQPLNLSQLRDEIAYLALSDTAGVALPVSAEPLATDVLVPASASVGSVLTVFLPVGFLSFSEIELYGSSLGRNLAPASSISLWPGALTSGSPSLVHDGALCADGVHAPHPDSSWCSTGLSDVHTVPLNSYITVQLPYPASVLLVRLYNRDCGEDGGGCLGAINGLRVYATLDALNVSMLTAADGALPSLVHEDAGVDHAHDRPPFALDIGPWPGIIAQFITLALPGRRHLQLREIEIYSSTCAPPVPFAPPFGQPGTCNRSVELGDACCILCDAGYEAVGPPYACLEGGRIYGSQACQPRSCVSPLLQGLPVWSFEGSCGNAHVWPHQFHCSVACNPGYELVGSANFSCAFGVISGAQQCSPMPCRNPVLTPPPFATRGDCNISVLPDGSSCSIACVNPLEYRLVGPPSLCTLGTLSDLAQSCEPRDCDPSSLSPPAFGSLGSCAATFLAHGSNCSFSCDVGYAMRGSPMLCVRGSLLGDSTCEPSGCNPPPAPLSTGQSRACSQPMASGATCSIDCSSGYEKHGIALHCAYGNLTGGSETCLPADCANPVMTAPAFGSRGTCSSPWLKHGSVCSISCQGGFAVVGEPLQCAFGTILQTSVQSCAVCSLHTFASGNMSNCAACPVDSFTASPPFDAQSSWRGASACMMCPSNVSHTSLPGHSSVRADLQCAYDNFALSLDRALEQWLLVRQDERAPHERWRRMAGLSSTEITDGWSFAAWLRLHSTTNSSTSRPDNSSLTAIVSQLGSWALALSGAHLQLMLPGVNGERQWRSPPQIHLPPLPIAEWNHIALSCRAYPPRCRIASGECNELFVLFAVNGTFTSTIHLLANQSAGNSSDPNTPLPDSMEGTPARCGVRCTELSVSLIQLTQPNNRSLLIGAHWQSQLGPLPANSSRSANSSDVVAWDEAPLAIRTFHGEIDEVKLWTRAVSLAEINATFLDHVGVLAFTSPFRDAWASSVQDSLAANHSETMEPAPLGMYSNLTVYLDFSEGGGRHTGSFSPAELVPSAVEAPFAWPKFVQSGPLCYPVSRCSIGSAVAALSEPLDFPFTPCCVTCPPGRFALSAASRCLRCPLGRFIASANASTCDPCPAGMTTDDAGASSCVPAQPSLPSFPPYPLIITEEQIASRRVKPVPFSPVLRTDDTPRSIDSFAARAPLPATFAVSGVCQPGSFVSPRQIQPPALGWDNSLTRAASVVVCEACAAGQFANSSNSASCSLCPVGRFAATIGATVCDLCSPGTASPQAGRSVCLECQAGRFSATNGLAECSACPLGSMQNQTAETQCRPCDPGTFGSHAGLAECSRCPLHSFTPASGAIVCDSCPVNSYADRMGSSNCSICPSGSASLPLAAQERIRLSRSCAFDNFALYLESGKLQMVVVPLGLTSAMAGPVLPRGNSFTIMAFVRPTSSAASMAIVSLTGSWALGLENGRLHISLPFLNEPGWLSPPSAVSLAGGEWRHVAVRAEAFPHACHMSNRECSVLSINLYVDGAVACALILQAANAPFNVSSLSSAETANATIFLVDSLQMPDATDAEELYVGAHWAVATDVAWPPLLNASFSRFSRFYDGEIDEVKLFSRALSAAEVQTARADHVQVAVFEDPAASDALRAHFASDSSSLSYQLRVYLGFSEGGGSVTGVYPPATLLPSSLALRTLLPQFLPTGPLCYAPSRCPAGSQPLRSMDRYPEFALTPCCVPCTSGSFSVNGSQTCYPCPLGTFATDAAASTCALCPLGNTSSSVGATACELLLPSRPLSHTDRNASVLLLTLLAAYDGASTPVERNEENDDSLAVLNAVVLSTGVVLPRLPSDAVCPAGRFTTVAVSASTNSSLDRFVSNHQTFLSCDPCAAGRFASHANRSRCEDCAPGSFADGPGHRACSACPVHTFAPGEGSIECSACHFFAERSNATGAVLPCPCGDGTYEYFVNGTRRCMACPWQTYSISGASFCDACAVGDVTISSDATECVACPASSTALPFPDQMQLMLHHRCAPDNFALRLQPHLRQFIVVPRPPAGHLGFVDEKSNRVNPGIIDGVEAWKPSSSWTLSLWVRPDGSAGSSSANEELPSGPLVSQYQSWHIRIDQGAVVLELPGIGTVSTAADSPLVIAAEWTHVTVALTSTPTGCNLGLPDSCISLLVHVFIRSNLTASMRFTTESAPSVLPEIHTIRVQTLMLAQNSTIHTLFIGTLWSTALLVKSLRVPQAGMEPHRSFSDTIDQLDAFSTPPFFGGSVDEIKCWSRMLTDIEVLEASLDILLINGFSSGLGAAGNNVTRPTWVNPHVPGLYANFSLYFGFPEDVDVNFGGVFSPAYFVAADPDTQPAFTIGPLCYVPSACPAGSAPVFLATVDPSFSLSPCCALCPPGTYSANTSTTCLRCARGYFQPLSGQSSCLRCIDDTSYEIGATTCSSNVTHDLVLTAAPPASLVQAAAELFLSPEAAAPSGFFAFWAPVQLPLSTPVGRRLLQPFVGETVGLVRRISSPNGFSRVPYSPMHEIPRSAIPDPDVDLNQREYRPSAESDYREVLARANELADQAWMEAAVVGHLIARIGAAVLEGAFDSLACACCDVGCPPPPCPPGTWKRGVGDCVSCDAGWTSMEEDSPGPRCTIPCQPGFLSKKGISGDEFLDRLSANGFPGLPTICRRCPALQYSTAFNSSSCRACSAGSVSVPTAAPTGCSPCDSDHYASTETNLCTFCDPGKHILEGKCVDCPPGTSTDDGSGVLATPPFSCHPCTANRHADAGASACLSCEAGRFATGDHTGCTMCDVGWGELDGHCQPCVPGRYSDGDTVHDAIRNCNLCPFGRFQNASMQTACMTCDPGSVPTFGRFPPDAPVRGAAGCAECTFGVSDALGQLCVNCTSGHVIDRSINMCTACPAGTQQAQDPPTRTSLCRVCEPSTYSAARASTICSSCPESKYTPLTGLTSCLLCGNGTAGSTGNGCVCDAGFSSFNASDGSCSLCPLGRYQPSVNNATACRECGEGTALLVPSVTTSCLCAAGFVNFSTETGQCYPCSPGSVMSRVNSLTSCEICGPNKYASGWGSTACAECPLGSPAGSSVCACPPNQHFIPRVGRCDCIEPVAFGEACSSHCTCEWNEICDSGISGVGCIPGEPCREPAIDPSTCSPNSCDLELWEF